MIQRDYTTEVFSLSYILQTLREKGLSLKKSLGQNLLINRDVAGHVLRYADLQPEDRVLEIGPGLGALTFFIAETVQEVVAVEIDRGFANYLSDKVDELAFGTAHIINGDFLSLVSADLPFKQQPNRVVSNFPYSIAIKALIRIVDEYRSVETITGMVQRELAERISAVPGTKNYSFVSVYLQYHMVVRVVEKRVSPQNFFPKPDIESSIVTLTRKTREESSDVLLFKEIGKKAFSNRRKRLAKNLKSLPLTVPGSHVDHIVEDLFGNPGVRAEELSVADFTALLAALKPYVR